MSRFTSLFLSILCVLAVTTRLVAQPVGQDVVIENDEVRLTLTADGKARGLLHKPTGQECLVQGSSAPVFALTEYRPYDPENMLTYVAKTTTFPANKVVREGDSLFVNFDRLDYTAVIALNITPHYIGFTLARLDYTLEDISQFKRVTEIDEFTLLQLPVKKRSTFGERLNVVWDDEIAVNVLGTDPYTKVDSQVRDDHILLSAGMESIIKLLGVGAALITTTKDNFLDYLAVLEHDFNLPPGVDSRRLDEYGYSYYEMRGLTKENIDEHIAYAKMGGFKMMVLYWKDFATSLGHFPWKKEYPNGMADLQEVTRKIREAGIIPGFHIHFNKATRNDKYVTPVPDARLNLTEIFTLSQPIDEASTEIYVEESPHNCTMERNRRILKINTELIEYEGFTVTRPYKFTGCKRGHLNSTPRSAEKGAKFGLLDVDTSPQYVRFAQRTTIQDEMAERLANIIDEAGFDFLYFDGGEDVHPPYWYYGSKAQLDIYNAPKRKPLFSEGALKTHFGWHILTRANAYDTFKPERFRAGVRKYMLNGARYMAENFTAVNFGWNIYQAPTETSNGYQPDMYEFVCSRGAAWDSPISLMVVSLDDMDNHPRTEDNLRVMKKWEEARLAGLFTDEQKEMLKDPFQEHILLNVNGNHELLPYERVENFANNHPDGSAFLFTRNGKTWVVFWHQRGDGKLTLPVSHKVIKLYDRDMKLERKHVKRGEVQTLPIDNRRFIEFDLPESEVIELLKRAEIVTTP
jgi:hypothetical protein